MIDHTSKGFAGEDEVIMMLKKALGCTVSHHKGVDDKGFDLTVHMPSTEANNKTIIFPVQVKTGKSYVKEINNSYRIKPKKKELEKWKNVNVPTLFVWVNDSPPISAYWQIIEPNTSLGPIFISKKRNISPVTKFDISLKIKQIENRQIRNSKLQTIDKNLFVGNIGKSFREEAKIFYKEMIGKKINNPILGETKITWNGWKHMTSQRRPISNIFNSLRLLSVIPFCIEHSDYIGGFRRSNDFIRGNKCYELRLIVFYKKMKLLDYPPTEIALVLKEIIIYPLNWRHTLEPHKETTRTVIFESIYDQHKKMVWP